MHAGPRDLSEVLLGVAQTLTANLDLLVVLPTILEQLACLVEYDSASIMLLEGEWLRSVARRSVFPIDSAPLTLQTHELAHIQEAMTTRQPVLIEDTERDPYWRTRSGSTTIRCWLGVPLIVHDRVVGLLNISHHTPEHFDLTSVQTTGAFATFAAIALNNAALHQQVQDELVERIRVEAELRQERARLAERVAEQTSLLRVANQEMAQASRMKDEFLAAMSHELHTPLNSVINITDILLEGAYGTLNEGQQHALSVVAYGSKRLMSLISDVLDVTRIESGKLQLLAQEVEIDHLCRACLERTAIPEKKQRAIYTIAPAVTTMIADKHRLRQLLTNLLSNAAKFTAEGGAIGLDVQIEDERNCLTFTVWDTGIGVDDSDLHQLFHPFVQLDSSLSRRYEGTGLGLTIVLKLVALHGGSLSVESQKGCGSRFIVRLPHQAVLEEASPIAISPPPSPQLPFMLVLTTLERAGDLLVRNLRASDHHVEMMLQSTEGAPISTQPDLIIVNSDLPRSNLLQTLRNIRKSDLLGTAPIVVLTALHLPGDREAVLVAGASGYYIKPLSHQEFDQLLALCHRNVSDNPQTFVHGA
jgi:signal transduction histidine kinase/CheY-like chemotaxis protein